MSINRGDEVFVDANGNRYEFMLAGGALGFITANPVGSKVVSGERSYADFDTPSMIAQADFTGGLGQERLDDTTRYYDGYNVDTRGGKIILGPATVQAGPNYLSSADQALLTGTTANWQYIGGTIYQYNKIALPFTTPASFTSLYRMWVPLKMSSAINLNTLLFTIRTTPGGPTIATGEAEFDVRLSEGCWLEVLFNNTILNASTTYYLQIDTTSWFYVWATAATVDVLQGYNGAAWVATTLHAPVWFADPRLAIDAPQKFILGIGQDEVKRLWSYGGTGLRYIASDGTPTIVKGNDLVNPFLAFPGFRDAVFFSGNGTTNLLYLAPDNEVLTFNGQIGFETWSVLPGRYASRLAVYNQVLYLAFGREIEGFDGTNFSTGKAQVGNVDYPIRRMIAWNGYLYAGKDDGLYRIETPTGYPTTGSLTVVKVLDFTAQAHTHNFAFMTIYKDDLIFPIHSGLMRFTTSGVLTSIAYDAELELSSNVRGYYTAAVANLETLFVAKEAPLGGVSSIMAYLNGAWHPVFATARRGDMLRSLLLEPGLYQSTPTLWAATGLEARYLLMPTTTARRWLWDFDAVAYQGSGYWLSSWFDGGLRTIYKKWLRVEIEAYGVSADYPLSIAYSTLEATDRGWNTLTTTITADGFTNVDFPAWVVSKKIQLRITMTGPTTSTPRIAFVGLRYVERFDNVLIYTRSYRLGTRQHYRGDQMVEYSLAEQIANLETLRAATAPLTFYPWSGQGPLNVYIMDISGGETPADTFDGGQDQGEIVVTVRLMEV